MCQCLSQSLIADENVRRQQQALLAFLRQAAGGNSTSPRVLTRRAHTDSLLPGLFRGALPDMFMPMFFGGQSSHEEEEEEEEEEDGVQIAAAAGNDEDDDGWVTANSEEDENGNAAPADS